MVEEEWCFSGGSADGNVEGGIQSWLVLVPISGMFMAELSEKGQCLTVFSLHLTCEVWMVSCPKMMLSVHDSCNFLHDLVVVLLASISVDDFSCSSTWKYLVAVKLC